jgi:hypothetical protein
LFLLDTALGIALGLGGGLVFARRRARQAFLRGYDAGWQLGRVALAAEWRRNTNEQEQAEADEGAPEREGVTPRPWR